jgi:hypothetical protein
MTRIASQIVVRCLGGGDLRALMKASFERRKRGSQIPLVIVSKSLQQVVHPPRESNSRATFTK